jgi:peptidoglycan/xylan/chitin deacetylase (PgdA/CDA1 family)
MVNNLRYALPLLEDEQVPATFFVSTPQLMGRSILWPDQLTQWAKTQTELDYLGQRFYRSSHGTFRSVKGELLTDTLVKLPRETLLAWIAATERNCGTALTQHEAEWRIMNREELQQCSKSPLVEIGSHGISHVSFTALTEEELATELIESKTYIEQTINGPVVAVAFPFGLYNKTVLAHAEAAGYRYLVGVDAQGSEPSKVIYRTGLHNLHSPLHSIDSVHRQLEKPFTFHP